MFRRMTKQEWQLRAQAVTSVLKEKGLAPMKNPEPAQIGVISGRDESVLVWMAANYLLGSSDGLETQRWVTAEFGGAYEKWFSLTQYY